MSHHQNHTCVIVLCISHTHYMLALSLVTTCKCGSVMSSVALDYVSVCLCVCPVRAPPLKNLDMQISFSAISRPSSHIKVIGSRSRSRSQKHKGHTRTRLSKCTDSRVVRLPFKGNLVLLLGSRS